MISDVDLQIRRFTDVDEDSVWRLLKPALEAGDVFAWHPGSDQVTGLKYWLGADRSVFCAVLGERVVGSYYLRPNHPGGGSHVANCGYLVDPSARGLGIARAMCEHSLNTAKEMGFRSMQFNFVVSTNEDAVHLWKAMGFEIIGVLPEAFRHPSLGLVDAYVMYRHL